jgi:hypothetical protein
MPRRPVLPFDNRTNGLYFHLSDMQMETEIGDLATSGQLVEIVASALDIPAATVAVYDRMLSEAGVRTKGGRGRSAAHMTARDAANLLIAIASSPITGSSVANSVQHWSAVANLKAISGMAAKMQPDKMGVIGKMADLAFGLKPLGDQPGKLRETAGRFDLGPLSLTNLQNLNEAHTASDALTALLADLASDYAEESFEYITHKPVFKYSTPVVVEVTSPLPRLSILIEARHWIERMDYSLTADRRPRGFWQLRSIPYISLRAVAKGVLEEAK